MDAIVRSPTSPGSSARVTLTACRAILPGMSGGPSIEDQRARQQFVADSAAMARLDLCLEDLADRDVRAVVIRAEHPEFEQALKAGVREFDGPNGRVNPRLHLIMHGIVATQLWDNSPPEAWETARRLL